MKKILVISDTHGDLMLLPKALKETGGIDALIHLGDICDDENELARRVNCPLYFVPGNNDWLSRAPRELTVPIAGKTVYMTHGDRFHVSYGLDRLKYRAEEQNADVAMFGHTHVPLLEMSGKPWLMNPGSLSRPYSGRSSFIVITVDDEGIWHPEVKFINFS
jgi:putative phosphoesterase